MNNSDLEQVELQDYDAYNLLRRSVIKYCVLLLIVVGTVGNILTVIVLLRRLRSSQANSTNFYLCVLSIADLVCIYVGLPNYFLSHVYELDLRNSFEVFCRLQTFLVYTFSHFAVWTLSVVTIDRTIWTALPFKAKEICTIRKAKIIIAAMGTTLMLVNSHLLWTLHVADMRERYNESEAVMECTEYAAFEQFATVGVTWMDLYLLSIFPFAILITCNCIIITKLRQYSNVRKKLLTSRQATVTGNTLSVSQGAAVSQSHSQTNNMSSNSNKEHSLTMMLLTTSLFFIATTLPITVCNFIYVTVDTTLRKDESSAQAMTWFQMIATLLSYLNISIQFVLFCLSGKSFRAEVRTLLLELLGLGLGRSRSSATRNGRANRKGSTNVNIADSERSRVVLESHSNWFKTPASTSDVHTLATTS